MGYLLLMTFAGSALLIGYLCWEKTLGKSMTQCMRYRALTIVMLTYVIPWEWIEGTYRFIIDIFRFVGVYERAEYTVNIANIETKEIAYQTKDYRILTIVMSVWFAVAVLILLIRIAKPFKEGHELRVLAIACGDKDLEPTLECLWETIRCRRRPKVMWTRADNETFTTGIIRPVIFLQKKYAEGDLYWILKHEIMHIVKRDLWVKLLLEFVCCLHWFNPLIYLLEHEMKGLCETSCDERVIRGCTEEECRVYMDLLDRNKKTGRRKAPSSSVLRENGEIDKRIALMKGRKDIGSGERTIAICAFVFLVFLDSLTALAYPKVHHVKIAVAEAAEDSIDGYNLWAYDYAGDKYDTFTDAILYDEQFVDEDGEIYPVKPVTEQEICSEHNVVSGIIQIHQKDSDGGCVIEAYEGTRCTECGAVWKGKWLRRARKFPCSH